MVLKKHSIHWLGMMLCLCALLMAGCQRSTVTLASAISETEANTMVTLLNTAGIRASIVSNKEGELSLQVAAEDESDARTLLRDHGFPRKRYENLGQVFKKDSLVSSPLEEQARYVYALAQQLEETLSHIDGVAYVKVHPVLPKKSSLIGPEIHASAGVFIKYYVHADLTPMIPQIRQLVSRSIPDLEPDRVSVVAVAVNDVNENTNTSGKEEEVSARNHTMAYLIKIISVILLLCCCSALGWWYIQDRKRKNSKKNQEVDEQN